MFKIEKDVKRTVVRRGRQGSKYPFADMERDDCFRIPAPKDEELELKEEDGGSVDLARTRWFNSKRGTVYAAAKRQGFKISALVDEEENTLNVFMNGVDEEDDSEEETESVEESEKEEEEGNETPSKPAKPAKPTKTGRRVGRRTK